MCPLQSCPPSFAAPVGRDCLRDLTLCTPPLHSAQGGRGAPLSLFTHPLGVEHRHMQNRGANGVRGGEGVVGGLRFRTPFCPSAQDTRRPARKRECAGSWEGTGWGILFPPCRVAPVCKPWKGGGGDPPAPALRTAHARAPLGTLIPHMGGGGGCTTRGARDFPFARAPYSHLPPPGLHATPPFCRR